jgi:hypothetical protein
MYDNLWGALPALNDDQKAALVCREEIIPIGNKGKIRKTMKRDIGTRFPFYTHIKLE